MIRDTIIRKIVELELGGYSLLEERIEASDELLHAAAVHEFGSQIPNYRQGPLMSF